MTSHIQVRGSMRGGLCVCVLSVGGACQLPGLSGVCDPTRCVPHPQGMFNRTIRMLASGVKPVFVFDGKPPTLKGGEVRGWVRCTIMCVCMYMCYVSSGYVGPTALPSIHPCTHPSVDTFPTKKNTAGQAPAEAGGGRGGA